MDVGSNISSTEPCIDTVRALHQTVIALRAALEQSKQEILELKARSWPVDSIEQTLKSISIENHVLRRQLISNTEQENNTKVDFHTANSEVDHFPPNLEKFVPATDLIVDNTVAEDDTDEIQFNQLRENEPLLDIQYEVLDLSIKTINKESDAEHIENVDLECSKSNQIIIQPNSENIDTDEDLIKSTHELSLPDVEELDQHWLLPDDERQLPNLDIEIADSTDLNIENSDQTIPKLPQKKVRVVSPKQKPKKYKQNINSHQIEASLCIKSRTLDENKISRSLESLTVVKTPYRKLKFSKSTNFFNLKSAIKCEIYRESTEMSGKRDPSDIGENVHMDSNQFKTESSDSQQNDLDQEVDDIELIFTTDDTKDADFKEQLVSIDSVDSQTVALNLHPPDNEHSLDVSDRELEDDVFNDNFENENQENNYQMYEYKRENSQLYNSKSDNSINHGEKSFKSYYSYQDSSFENKSLEKDESFDRFEERIRIVETDISKCGIQDVDYVGIRRNTCPNPLQYRPLLHREALTKGIHVKKSRPILEHSNATRRESGAQTDISALPGSSWRSESSLAHKAHGDPFTTLPSKYHHPGSRLRLSEKTVEARRVLLSDIGFTSMVPELSRSADYLCPENLKPPVVTTHGQFLRTPELYSPAYTSQRFTWTATTATPSDGSHSHSRYSSIYPLSPPAPSRRCSAPVSPSRRATLKSNPSRVRFANTSLPELRGDWTVTVDSGDSTDSLVEEAENYLRRSIDCIGRDTSNYCEGRRTGLRRASAPEPSRDNVPPQGWQPFLPRIPRDLKPDHWVKVITPEGRVRGGRVRYVGPVLSQIEQFVGVQLSNPDGYCDGMFTTRRYFQCSTLQAFAPRHHGVHPEQYIGGTTLCSTCHSSVLHYGEDILMRIKLKHQRMMFD